jgi:hypothetical protein
VKALKDIDVDDLACLIDFGLDTGVALEGLGRLDEVRRQQN